MEVSCFRLVWRFIVSDSGVCGSGGLPKVVSASPKTIVVHGFMEPLSRQLIGAMPFGFMSLVGLWLATVLNTVQEMPVIGFGSGRPRVSASAARVSDGWASNMHAFHLEANETPVTMRGHFMPEDVTERVSDQES